MKNLKFKISAIILSVAILLITPLNSYATVIGSSVTIDNNYIVDSYDNDKPIAAPAAVAAVGAFVVGALMIVSFSVGFVDGWNSTGKKYDFALYENEYNANDFTKFDN